MNSNPDVLKQEILNQLGLPEPDDIRVAWGADWEDNKWTFSQSSGVLASMDNSFLWKVLQGCYVWYDVSTSYTIL